MDHVELTFHILRDMPLSMPRARTPAGLLTFGLGDSLDSATKQAISGMLDHIKEVFDVTRPEAAVLASAQAFYAALNTLRGIATSEIMIPGPHERWEQALQVGYRASSVMDARLDSWQDELEIHHEREGRAENALLDEEGE